MTLFFFFKQKTAYEMRISDWSSDVCSSDLIALLAIVARRLLDVVEHDAADLCADHILVAWLPLQRFTHADFGEASAVEGRVVEIADAVAPCGLDGRQRFLLGDRAKHVAERRRSEAQAGGKNVLQCQDVGPCVWRFQATASGSSVNALRDRKSTRLNSSH